MKLSVITISVEKSNTSGWAWKLDQWVKKINTLKETIMLLKYELADEAHLCQSQHWPVLQTLKKPISVLPLSL